MAIQEGWITASQAHEDIDLKVAESTLRHWAKKGWVKSEKVGRTVLYKRADIEREKATIHPRNRQGRPKKGKEEQG